MAEEKVHYRRSFSVLGAIFAIYLPNIYRANSQLVSAEQESGGLSGMAAQYGGLAAMAGINLGGDSSKLDQAVALASSWPFVNNFVEKYDLKPAIFAVDYWDKNTGQLVYDAALYDVSAKTWKIKGGESQEPTSWEVYLEFSKMMVIEMDAKSGILNIAVKHKSPIVAARWVTLYSKELNLYFQQRDMRDAKQNIDYLRAEIDKTTVTLLQERLHGLIETQMQTLMLSEVSDEYLLRTLVPALPPEEKISPKRALIVVLFAVMGGFFSVIYVIVESVTRKVSAK